MSKNIMIVAAVLVAVAVGFFFVSSRKTEPQPTETIMEQPTEVTVPETGVMAEETRIEIKDFKYAPATITVKPGTVITVTNLDVTGHSVTSDDKTSFDTGVLSKDKSANFTAPTKPGTYAFHCIPHPSIKGTLIVQ